MTQISFSEDEINYINLFFCYNNQLKWSILNSDQLLITNIKVPFSLIDCTPPFYCTIDLDPFNFLDFLENCIEIQNYIKEIKKEINDYI